MGGEDVSWSDLLVWSNYCLWKFSNPNLSESVRCQRENKYLIKWFTCTIVSV